MKTTMRAITLAAMAAVSGAAVAADLPARGPTPYYSQPASYYNWSGLYAGVNAGYEWGHVTSSSIDPSGIAGGGQVGYNFQTGQFVFGGETDIQASAADDTFAPWKFSNPWFGTLRGRAGYALNNILFYGTVGIAYGELAGQLNSLEENKTLVGWTGWCRHGSRSRSEMVGQGGISLHGPRRSRLHDHRREQRPAKQHAASRHQLSLLERIHSRVAENPGLSRPGFFFAARGVAFRLSLSPLVDKCRLAANIVRGGINYRF